MNKKNGTLIKTLFSSFHKIIICMVILFSFTWAWFSERIVLPTATIQSATYSAQVSVSSNDAGFVPVTHTVNTEGGITVEVDNGKRHDIRIIAEGTAPKGFCVISAGDVVCHTAPLAQNEEMVLTVEFSGTGTTALNIQPYWGSYREALNAGEEVTAGDAIVLTGDVSAAVVSPGDNSEGQ